MTDIDSSKVIEKLTEVLELLKTKKDLTEEPKKEESKEESKEVDKCDPEVDKCLDKCPFKKMMSEKEFKEFCKIADKEMKKGDLIKICPKGVCSKGECEQCPLTNKLVFDLPEEFGQERKIDQTNECLVGFQVINTILSLVFFVLCFVFLFRSIKGLYCTV